MKTDIDLKQKKAKNTNKTTEQLRKEVARLKKEIFRLQTSNKNKEKYRAAFEQTLDALLLIDTESGCFLEFNASAYKNLGYTRKEFKGMKVEDFEGIESPAEVKKHIASILKNGPTVFETKHRRKNGQIRAVLVRANPVKINKKTHFFCVWSDITEQKHLENLLREKNQDLGNTVTAMKVLLKQIERDKTIVKKNILYNLEGLVSPYLKNLYNNCKDYKQKKYLEIIKSNLNQLCKEISNVSYLKDLKLTSSEMQVANLIKHNNTSKEISKRMNIAVSTVDFHRKNIRKKLNLKNSKTNLKSYLSALQD